MRVVNAPVLLAGVAATLVQPCMAARPAQGQSDVMRSAYHDFRVITVVEGVVHPWSIAFLPNGDMLVTEKPGRLRIVRDGLLLPTPVPGVPDVYATGQGGLHEVLPHPEFASNRLVYLSYSKPLGDGKATTAVVRGTLQNDRFTQTDKVFEAVAASTSHQSFGGRLAFAPDGRLWLTVGDRAPSFRWWQSLGSHPAQDLRTHHGVVVRLRDDGSVPEDNPFVGDRLARPETWSYGHRNPQGLAIHPETGVPWITEHGPQRGDEVNRLEAGKNYGWPVIGYGADYGGHAVHGSTHAEGMEQPRHVWARAVGPSGLAFYTGDKFPEWRGSLFAGSLREQRLDRFTVEDGRIEAAETVLQDIGRIRDVRQGPDGYIYLAIVGRGRLYGEGPATRVVRLEPAGQAPGDRGSGPA